MFNLIRYFFEVVFPAPKELSEFQERNFKRRYLPRHNNENSSECPLLCLGRYVTQSDIDKQKKEALNYSF